MSKAAILPMVLLSLACGVAACTAPAAEHAAVEQATKAADAWLKLVDDGSYRQSWDQASSVFKDQVPEAKWEQGVETARKPLGRVVSRKLKLARYSTTLPGAPDGQYVVIQYDSSLENKESAIETVTPMLDKDGQWRVSGYYIK